MNVLKRNNVRVIGDKGPTLLYAHGFGCSQRMWDRVTPAFASTNTQILFDYVGSGASDLSEFDEHRYSSLQGYVQDLLDVCDELKLESDVTFVGHSVSSSVGLLASIERPKLFKEMVLIGPSPCFLNLPPEYQGGFNREDLEELLALMDQNYLGWANYLGSVVAGKSGGGGSISSELTNSFCSTDPRAARVFAKTTFFADNRSDLPLVTCPSLILQHSEDALAPLSIGEYMHHHLPKSTLKVLNVAGHCGHMSHPYLVIDAMRNYFNALPSSIPN
ncbi:alpha/beta fold hydrolase [Undibacterium sp. Xuan67W]|uniref:alpha/beta fold hydrolase n=1 Tax=Undibacterium sp. Xuan67W TaxID=3413057 RepID=UPI003BF3EC63